MKFLLMITSISDVVRYNKEVGLQFRIGKINWKKGYDKKEKERKKTNLPLIHRWSLQRSLNYGRK